MRMLLLFLALIPSLVLAESCTVTERTCLEGPSQKRINGYLVTRDCWQWQETRLCSSGESVDHCTTLAGDASCSLEKEECLSMNASGKCSNTQRTYACDHEVSGLPNDNVALDVRVSIESSFDKAGACAALINDATCTEQSHICTETTGTKTVDGVDVTLSCWAEQYSYSCKTADESLTCALLGGAGCSLYKEVSETSTTSVDQYACVTGKTSTIPTHEDIVYLETITVTDGYTTDDSACKSFAESQSCTLSNSTCGNQLTESICGTENRTYTCQTSTESFTCTLLSEAGCTHYKDVGEATDKTIDQYACVQGSSGPIPTHQDISFIETITVTDGYQTDDSACKTYADSELCTLKTSSCGTQLTESVCGTENRTYTCQTSPESLTCTLLGGVGCTHYKDVSDTTGVSVDQYACVQGGTGTIPTHDDIDFIETITVTDGYNTDDSACKAFASSQSCSLTTSTCSNQLTESICGTENRTYTCQTSTKSESCILLDGVGCTHYKDVSDTTIATVEQYACDQGSSGPIPTHEDIVFIETLKVTDGYNEDASACKTFEESATCSLTTSQCTNQLTESVCATESRTYTCESTPESITCALLGNVGCSLYKEVSETSTTSVDQYVCVQGSTGPIPTHEDIVYLETLTITDGYTTDDSACKSLENSSTCSLTISQCDSQLTESICGTESRTYTCQTSPESLTCTLLGGVGCTHYKDVSDTTGVSVDQYACVQGGTGTIPSHQDIVYVDTITVTDGYTTDDSACQHYEDEATCSLESSQCASQLTESICGTENRTYTCAGDLDTDACSSLDARGCTPDTETCTNKIGDVCLIATKDYICKSALPTPLASSIMETGREEVIDSITATSNCPTFTTYTLRASSLCQEVSRLCTESGATKIVDGNPVYKDCWHYEVTYQCEGQSETVNGCEVWETNNTCELVSEECLATNDSECTYATRTYKCKETLDKVVTQEKCTESVCAYGFCETRESPDNTGLYDSVLKMEIARQAAVYGDYDDTSNLFFKGELNTCENKKGQNCCAGKVKGNMSNDGGLSAAYIFGIDATKEAIKTLGSPYVYDVLSSHESMEPLLNKLYGTAANGAYSPSLSYYGITVSYTGGSMALSFNPYTFFAMVALEVATEYFSCEPEEQALQLKKGQNLCVYLGSRCTQYNMGSCLVKEEQYCCYNSRLARIVQEAAKEQFGASWGTLDRPDCSGLSVYEFMTLDFSKIDLSEFLSDIASQQLAEIDSNRITVQTEERIEELKNATDKYEPMDTKTGVVGQ